MGFEPATLGLLEWRLIHWATRHDMKKRAVKRICKLLCKIIDIIVCAWMIYFRTRSTLRQMQYVMSSAKKDLIAEQIVSSYISCFYTFAIVFFYQNCVGSEKNVSFRCSLATNIVGPDQTPRIMRGVWSGPMIFVPQ